MSQRDGKELLAEAVAYFGSRPALGRLLSGFVEKYRSLGRLGGKVILEHVSPEEKTALEDFFRQRLPAGRLSISAQLFQRALAETRFCSLDPVEILWIWNGGWLTSRRQEQEQLARARQETIAKLLAAHQHPFCQAWLKAALAGEPGTRRIIQAVISHEQHSVGQVTVVLRAMSQLPAEYKRLPVFAREVSGDPHGLDIDSETGKLFLEGLRYVSSHGGGQKGDGLAEGLSTIEEITALLYQFHLLRDDLLNFVTCMGLAAYDEQGKEITYWREATQAGAPLNAPLREIVRAAVFFPAAVKPDKGADFFGKSFTYEVLVMENSGVYSALVDEISSGGHAGCSIPLVCLHGQLKLASWALLDRLVQSGAIIRYAGDFDPEGLQIAEKLLLRYPGRVRLWRMSVEDYRQAAPSVAIDRARLNKLKSIKSPALADLAQCIHGSGLAAYQEGLWEKLAADVRSLTSDQPKEAKDGQCLK